VNVAVRQQSMPTLRAVRVGRPRIRWQDRSRLQYAGLLAAALHGAVLAGLLLSFRHTIPVREPPDQEAAVELVMIENKGANVTTAPPQPSPQVAVPTPPPPPPPPPPDKAAADEAVPPVPPPPPPAAAPPSVRRPPIEAPPVPRAQEAPQISLGGTDSDTNAIATGPNLIPASVDTKFRNKDPVYPLEASIRGEHGAVTLLIHVSPEGLASDVDIAQSSGYTALDRAARDAVLKWHFLPAVRDGKPIEFEMPLRVVFRVD
jgi:periplasmic protein TonB